MTDRPSWDEYFRELTLVTAKRSACERLKVGCVIVKDNRIVAQGYNGYLPGAPHKQVMRDGHEVATVHAEQNAITDCARRGVSCEGATVYISTIRETVQKYYALVEYLTLDIFLIIEMIHYRNISLINVELL